MDLSGQGAEVNLPVAIAPATLPLPTVRSRAGSAGGRVLRKLRGLLLLLAILLLWQYVSLRVLDRMTRTLLPPPTAVVWKGALA